MGRNNTERNTPTPQQPSPPASPRTQNTEIATAATSGADAKSGDDTTPHPSTSAIDGRSMSPERVAMRDLFASMNLRTALMGKAVDALSEEFQKVAILTQAIVALEQINLLKQELADRDVNRKQRIEEEKEKLRASVENYVRDVLMQQAKGIIEDLVNKDLKARVARVLDSQIPESLRSKIADSQTKLWNDRVKLHNFDIKRFHAAIPPHSEFEHHPIKPPYPRLKLPSATSRPSATSSPVGAVNGAPPSPLSMRTNSRSAASPTTVGTPIERPAASPIFPQKMKKLYRLTLDEAQQIVAYYDLQVPGEGTGPMSREQYINAILSAIGVPRKMRVPSGEPPPGGRQRPIITTTVSPVSTIRSALL
ncbi:hypothetical protein OE88DRAFT_1653301 [Heliocybe sulcata]|uniref:Uncharacterized protein n=1 Tax=Heliocybe sulcata TaxID=5364 RepID=A0A5C3NME1_9AGAM|nr:hypothetical protein OE88DRAFT_1653301 [Heliocybe sulcata]